MNNKKAMKVTRNEDFSMWYQEVVKESELAELAHVRGCMVIKPWGYGIWENIQNILGDKIKERGSENVYFPLFIPLSYISKEAKHVDGFAKEMAVVTHHRLEKDLESGQLIPSSELSEPVVVRPTSETIIGESMSQWIKSYKDLPLKLNQWCNVVRWEMRPRVFLRTVEFLWQEGHTAHASIKEARDFTFEMLLVYRDFVREFLAIPVIVGTKPIYDRFPGAVETYCIEAMMQDGKSLQAGTSHYLGDNFARAADIKFTSENGTLEYVHTTSWGVSTRLIGGLIMTHADDDGMRVPPKIATYQIVINTLLNSKDEELNEKINRYAEELSKKISSSKTFEGRQIKVKVDSRNIASSDKKWSWIKKGVPILIEIGKNELENNSVMYRLRSEDPSIKHTLLEEDFVNNVESYLSDIQNTYLKEAEERLQSNVTKIDSFEELEKYFSNEKDVFFVEAPYYDSIGEDERLKEMKVTIRCILLDEMDEESECILTGKKTKKRAIFAKSY
jgi:prolyl-tRNA synthetase